MLGCYQIDHLWTLSAIWIKRNLKQYAPGFLSENCGIIVLTKPLCLKRTHMILYSLINITCAPYCDWWISWQRLGVLNDSLQIMLYLQYRNMICCMFIVTMNVTASVMAVIVIGYFSLLIYCNGYVYDKPKFRQVARSSVTWQWDSSALCGLYLRLESGPFRLVTLCDAGHELRKAGSDSVSFQSCSSMCYFGNILHINSM